MKNVLIAIPTNKNIEVETFKSIYDLIIPEGYKTHFQYFFGYCIDQVRNLIADWGTKYDYLFCVDSDMIFPPNTLLKLLEADKDIVSGVYRQRKQEVILELYDSNLHNINISQIYNKGVVEVEACGFGCVLIKSDVLRNIEYPHFVYKSALNHNNTHSEDIFFCQKAKQYGFNIFVETSVICSHKGIQYFDILNPIEQNIHNVFNQDLLPKTFQSFIQDLTIEPKVIYDIGSCVLHFTRHAKARWRDSQIILFEANKSVEKLYSSQGYPYALGVLTEHDNTPLKFYKNEFNLGGNSYYKENTTAYSEDQYEDVIGMSLDTVVNHFEFPLPDLIKLDVQGAELDILKGASKCLENCSAIILEAQHTNYNIGAPRIDQIAQFLLEKGFKMNKSPINVTDVDADYFFYK